MSSQHKSGRCAVLAHPYSSLVEQVETMLSQHGKTRRKLLQSLMAGAMLPGTVACGGVYQDQNKSGGSSVGGTASAEASPYAMTGIRHPALLHTEADFALMKQKVDAGVEPWLSGWKTLTSNNFAQLGFNPRPLETVLRGGDGQNYSQMWGDMQKTYRCALRWKVSGDTAYADQAVRFLNVWSSTMKVLGGNADRFLASGIYGYQWAVAAEIMRAYPGWASEDVKKFQALLLNLFYPLCDSFLTSHNGTEHTAIAHYWANWDLCNICGIFAIGVFCDRLDLCNEALTYFTNGRGNGAAAHMVYMTHPGHLGQWQESGRDQGHSTLGISLAGALCEMAWNQGIDLYGYRNNRFLAGAEYVAKCNLNDAGGALYTLPFTYTNQSWTASAVSDGGRPSHRHCWASVYNHYVNRKGLSAPWLAAMVAQYPDGNPGVGDDPGFGTLTFSREPYVGDIPPSGLTAALNAGKVLLSWWGSAHATSYHVKRGTSANGPFTTLTSVTDPRTHTDNPGDGIWYYAITGVTANGETGISNVVRVALPHEPRLVLPLTGNPLDTSGLAHHGALNGGASWGDGRLSGKALALDGTDGYMSLPDGIMSDIGDFTIDVWVYWEGGSKANQRIFDFGDSDCTYATLLLELKRVRFAMAGANQGERCIYYYSPLPTKQWVHVAVTLSGAYGVLYINGVQAATDDRIEFAPFQMGKTRQNWLGRSQYSADPYFNGRMQDFRLYNGALTAQQIAALAAT
jgi:hypothetical protein